MADKIKFWPLRGTFDQIMAQPYGDGKIYFAVDTNQIIVDANNSKHIVAGSGGGGTTGSGIVYANGSEDDIIEAPEGSIGFNYIMPMRVLENSAVEPPVDGLILNSDGRFFRVISIDSANRTLNVLLLAVSGSGGGGGSSVIEQDIFLEYDGIDLLGSTYIYGQDNIVSFMPRSTADSYVSFLLTAKDLNGEFDDVVRQTRLYNGDTFEFNTNLLPKSNNIEITVLVNSPMSQWNKGRGLSLSFSPIRVLDMYIEKPSDITMGIAETATSLPYIPYFEGLGGANAPVKINYSVDGAESDETTTLVSANSKHKQLLGIPMQPHGMHTIRLWLSTTINGQEYKSSEIAYEVPFVEAGNEIPIIWIKNELGTVTNYEPAVIQYMVYSSVAASQGSPIEISLYHNSELLNVEEVYYASGSWLSMDITPYYEFVEDGQKSNTFSLVCGSATKVINFIVDDVGARNLSLVYPNSIRMNFDSIGRSNKEIRANRPKWTSKVNNYEARLKDFNWYTNGWMNDNNDMGSYLSVANGSSVSFPLPVLINENSMSLNTNDKPWTFEVRFRIRNAKKFATLVSEIPKYRYITTVNGADAVSEMGQEKTLEEIEAIGARPMLDSDGNMVMNEANTTKKVVQTEKYVAMKFLNSQNEGFAIGTQEAYFNTSGSTVNVKYKENEIINISFVVDHQNGLSIYLNGILSGVGSLGVIPPISMDSTTRIEINSKYCDFDLYKFRVYPTALTMPDVIHNYISDIKNVNIYDENQLTDVNDATALDYKALVEYNRTHPNDPTMPYAVIDMTATSQGTDLPHYKGAKRSVRIEFTNPVADYLLTLGEANGGISQYRYYTHCPSFTADDVELNVQGTSSQKYPRRNFKAKFKKSKNWIYTMGELAGKPVATPDPEDSSKTISQTLTTGEVLTANWHVDHETIGSNAFTWKIDYMESSGSYNTGFANLMGSGIYNKHPLEDLNLSGVNASDYRVNVYGFPMMVFHKTGENEYTYIGRYNMNLDKSSNERYGFELKKANPYLTLEKTEVDETTGESSVVSYHPTIKEIAECWELRDNQGTWCSWRYPNAEMRAMGFNARMQGSTESDPKIEVAQHFEARYHVNADEFEYAQNIILGKENEKDYSSKIGGSTNAAASAYVHSKLANLEILFNWLDSTDLNTVSNVVFDTPKRQLVSGKLSKKVLNPDFIPGLKSTDPGYQPEFIYIDDTEAMETNGVTYEVVTESGIQYTYGIFTKDSREYRRQKFYSEFEKHLDLHYCCVYFVMTELMLCYDSRGKNMMIASWGPRENGGDYIWYPIFYDIDTQLGLNNVGAKLWDYDEDNSENGTFSTKDSVLWVNLYDVFKSQVISTYRSLRNGKIDEATIENAYMCRAGTTFDSYAMMGKRPIVAIGLDEYYKYVLPVTQPWKDQEGNMVTANYLYACQGDRILSRELLIENRLLYMDSKWLGGSFGISTGGMAGANFRSTGNKPSTSSDIYLDGKRYDKDSGTYVDDPSVVYPMPYYDATPEYRVTPYLNFYVTTFVDENTFQAEEAYNEVKYPDGIPTIISPSVAEGYRSGQVDQQLNYFAGSKYISSFGDLSLKYLNEIHFPSTPRLLDITLGSDAPNYFNGETLNPLELDTELNPDGTVKAAHEKPLLQKINLTNVRGVNTYLDVRSPSKLEEFRALGTSLKYALFADGAPLNTVHLPNTITRLVFTQNKELKKLITATPIVADMVDGELVYRPHAEYEGLFVDGVTNYDSANAGHGSLITEVSFDGDALGYGSYTILKNIVSLKNGTGRGNRLSIRMADVNWTPYVQVEYGESKIVNTTYYYLTDHSTFEPYDHDDSLWFEDTLNGKVYTYNSEMDESIIPDMSLFELFYNDKNNTPSNEINQFTNNIESMIGRQSYPTISGEVYISNAGGAAIQESDLTDKYGVAFPNLKIRVAKVDPAYIVKYVQVLASGKEEEIDVIRYAREEGASATITAKIPYKQYCDFLGWSTKKEPTLETDWFVKYQDGAYTEILNPQVFSDENTVITLYAIFIEHPYVVTFKNPDGTAFATTTSTYGQPAKAPAQVPSLDERTLELTETYKFKGFSREAVPINANDRLISQSLVNLNNVYVTHDMELYAVYRKQSVYEETTNIDYFRFTDWEYLETGSGAIYDTQDSAYNVTNGVLIGVKPGVLLSGKITLPTYSPNGKPVVGVDTSFRAAGNNEYPLPTGCLGGQNITHIFWDKNNSKETLVRFIPDSSFACDVGGNKLKLEYFEFPSSMRRIEGGAFFFARSLKSVSFNEGLNLIAGNAFNTAFADNNNPTISEIHISSTVYGIGAYAFSNIYNATIAKVTFGDSSRGSQLTVLNNTNIMTCGDNYPTEVVFSGGATVTRLEFYGDSADRVNRFQKMVEQYPSSIYLLTTSNDENRTFAIATPGGE